MKTNTSITCEPVRTARRTWPVLGLLLLAFWFVMVDGRIDGLWFAVIAVVMGLLMRRAMPTPLALHNVSLVAIAGFIPYFIVQSLIGGVDVAWRSFHPKRPIEPGIYAYSFRIASEGARVFLAQVISLMPGTLACIVGEHKMMVHTLSGTRDSLMADIAAVEKRTARIFRETLTGEHDG